MQNPSFFGNSTAPDPYDLREGKLRLPIDTPFVPPDKQKPDIGYFNLAFAGERRALSDLMQRAFKKDVVLWNIESNWSKDGDYRVVAFYSEILVKKEPEIDPNTVTTIGANKDIVTKSYKSEEAKISSLEEPLFKEMEDFLDSLKNRQEDMAIGLPKEDSSLDLEIEDDEEND